MTPSQYLEAEFLRYFPEAHIEAIFYEDETIEVTVSGSPDDDPDYTFIMEIGSDDDWFSFSADGTGLVITVPLMPEEMQP